MIKSGQEKKENESVVEVKSASSEGEDEEDKFNGIGALFPGIKKFIDELKQIAKEVKEKAEEEAESESAEEKVYVTSDQLDAMEFNNVDVDELNNFLVKYEINTTERIRHFLSQFAIETGWGKDYVEYGSDEYLEGKYYYPYIGAGVIQLTHKYNYQAFATYKILEQYKDLNEIKGISHKPSSSNDAKTIENMYKKVLKESEDRGYDVSQYTKIIDSEEHYQYVADNFKWESGGYFWVSGDVNNIIDELDSNNADGVDDVTAIVNKYTDTYEKRKNAYETICETIK